MRISVVGAHKTGAKVGVPNPSAGEWNALSPMASGIDVCHWCVECVFCLFVSFCTDACGPSACVTERGMACLASGVCVGFPVFYVIPGMCFGTMVGLGVDKKQKKLRTSPAFSSVCLFRGYCGECLVCRW